MSRKRIIVWFRQDLRLHDNEALHDAISSGAEIFPIYIFDERVFLGKTIFDFPKTGIHRARFILESVQCLKESLRASGSDLIVRIGKPEEQIPVLARKLKTNWVYCNRERTREEVIVQDTLERNLWTIGQEVRYSRGKMLYYTADLPFPITHVPDSYASFKKEVEKMVKIRPPLNSPEQELKVKMEGIEIGHIPDLSELSRSHIHQSTNGIHVKGGEKEAIIRLKNFLHSELEAHGNTSAYQRQDLHFNSLMSAYLSQGCISPKKVYHEIRSFASQHNRPEIFESISHRLIYRDHLRLIAKKYGNLIFQPEGTHGSEGKAWGKDKAVFSEWATGNSGVPLIDAIMLRLLNTGLCTHRSRNLTASYLMHDLGLDWRLGASWFESQLIDYDPCSNWVNWMNLAGLGPGSKDVRKWNYSLQAKRLDPNGSFIEKWAQV